MICTEKKTSDVILGIKSRLYIAYVYVVVNFKSKRGKKISVSIHSLPCIGSDDGLRMTPN